MSLSDAALCLDIGGTHATAAIADLHARRVLEDTLVRAAIDADADADTLLRAWADLCGRARASAGLPGLAGVGIAMPGPFDYRRGLGKAQHKLTALHGVDVGARLRALLFGDDDATAIRFGNDAALFALGEWWAGAARGARRVLGVTLGTGLGSGFVVDGRVVEAGAGVAPEGQIWWAPYRDGVAEDYVSTRAIVAAYRRAGGTARDAQRVAAAARAGDPAALAAYAEFGSDLGAVLIPWLEGFGPDLLVLGGNITRSWDLFAKAFAAAVPVPVPTAVTTAFEHSSLLGAAALAR